MKKTSLIVAVVLIAATSALHAKPADARSGHSAPPEGGDGNRDRRPPPPIMAALDTNHDGEVSAEEIANASRALLALDKNGNGKLERDELRPAGGPPRDGPPPQGK